MRHVVPPPRVSSAQGLRLHRPRPAVRARAVEIPPVRVSDLILAVLSVCLLGAVAMFAGLSILAP
ncbi:hypothetical protein [Methylobacterium haplocladii]|uniref:Uncharacterized protein n=1 Tax=Methylobacterium haplocladii TaxID=1176176 RepID=A0A512IM58_9HYPH|nr:hypothetical protein [Methylobacterium haplocladii]GEO98800.1 hypothetical protein MHA02_11880 [Methylobacterium haplocladii]GJD84726.1 hypothetical protein HPGCJGGD_2608 [Methylobacterium haplocladii]GLS60232.1 hypothetical protein GCM10007887_29100 [Methylobacterium haplocladii]